jgi:hypothetical protein
MASDVTIKPSVRDRYEAAQRERPRRFGEQTRPPDAGSAV